MPSPRLSARPALGFLCVCATSWGAACTSFSASVGPEPTVLWEHAAERGHAAPAPLTKAEARRVALAHDAAHTCEETARAMARKDPARGWQVMEQCIRRTDFSDLEGLIEGPWAESVATSPDAALLLAHVIAVRGGDVGEDLKLLRRRKFPVYSLQAALAEPGSYKGRTVLLRATARDGRNGGSGRTFRLVETKVMAESEWVAAPRRPRLSTRIHDESADQPGVDVKGRGAITRDEREETEKVEVMHNVSVDTGRSLLARVDGDEPSFEPATDYVVVVRFDGERDVTDDEGNVDSEAGGSVIGYFEPETGLFARLSR